MTAAQRQAQFLKEFQALLDKHGAEFEIMDTGGSYHAQPGVANISMGSQYRDSECINDFVEFDLPSFMTPEKE